MVGGFGYGNRTRFDHIIDGATIRKIGRKIARFSPHK